MTVSLDSMRDDSGTWATLRLDYDGERILGGCSSALTQADFDAIPDQLNGRPRQTLASGHHHKHWPRCCDDRLNPHRDERAIVPMSGRAGGAWG